MRRGFEAVQKSPEEQKHSVPRRRDKGVEGAKKTRQFFFARLCVLVPLCGMSCLIFSHVLRLSEVFHPD
jgi:hypothetical protein